MATRIFDSQTWVKIGQPDLGSKMFYIDKTTNKKVFGKVTSINFGHKKGVEIKITPFKKLKSESNGK